MRKDESAMKQKRLSGDASAFKGKTNAQSNGNGRRKESGGNSKICIVSS